jgi:DNA-binding HxlR family transcriptional regulator
MKPKDKRRAKRSPCPVAATLDVIGDKWTLLIIRDLFAGKSRYRDLAASPERIASNILAARLERLQACGMVNARASSERVGSWEYRLSAKGRSLLPVLAAMRDWGLKHVSGTAAKVGVVAGFERHEADGPDDARTVERCRRDPRMIVRCHLA